MPSPAAPSLRSAAAALRAALTLEVHLHRERDHDAPRRIGEEICAAVARRGGLLAGYGDQLWAWLHPALPPLELQPAATEGGHAGVRVRACAWPGGPGYHEALREVIREAVDRAQAEATLKDVVTDHERSTLEARYAQAAVAAATLALDHLAGDGGAGRAQVQLGLPPDDSVDALELAGDAPGVHTIVGPRDADWLRAVADGRVAARELLPCWDRCFAVEGPPLDGPTELTLGRALALYLVAWGPRPPATDRQRQLRRRLGAALDAAIIWRERSTAAGSPTATGAAAASGPAPATSRPIDADDRALLDTLRDALREADRGLEVRLPGALRSSLRPRVAHLAGSWTATIPGHFEWQLPGSAPPAPNVVPGVHQLDALTRLETMAQLVPDGGPPLEQRAADLLASPTARAATWTRRLDEAPPNAPPFAAFLIERSLPDGSHQLMGQLAGAASHLLARIAVAPGGSLDEARALFRSLAPPAPAAPHRLVI